MKPITFTGFTLVLGLIAGCNPMINASAILDQPMVRDATQATVFGCKKKEGTLFGLSQRCDRLDRFLTSRQGNKAQSDTVQDLHLASQMEGGKNCAFLGFTKSCKTTPEQSRFKPNLNIIADLFTENCEIEENTLFGASRKCKNRSPKYLVQSFIGLQIKGSGA